MGRCFAVNQAIGFVQAEHTQEAAALVKVPQAIALDLVPLIEKTVHEEAPRRIGRERIAANDVEFCIGEAPPNGPEYV
jgi:hypothetical protein